MSDIEARVKKIIAEQLGVAEADVTNEKAFVADLGAEDVKREKIEGQTRVTEVMHALPVYVLCAMSVSVF